MTAGNFGAFDVWLDQRDGAAVSLETGHVDATIRLAEVGCEDYVIAAGGLDLELRLFCLPDELKSGPLSASVDVRLRERGDNPLWIRVTTEDGFQAWTSPIYVFKTD